MSETARADAGPAVSGTVPGIGTVFSAVAMATALVPVRRGVDDPLVWMTAAFAVAAVLAFLASRHGALERRVAAAGGVCSSLAVVVLSGYALNQGIDAPVALPAVSWSVPLLFVGFLAAGIAAGVGVADYFGIDTAGLKTRSRTTLVLGVFGVSVLFVSQFVMTLLAVPAMAALGELTRTQLVVIGQLGMALGTGAVAAGYLAFREYDLSYIDLRVPSTRDVLWIVAGIVVLFGALAVISLLFRATGVESAEHGTAQQAQQTPEILLVLVPASILVIGPFEELLYRNVIQKSLYETFSRVGAVLVGSVIFAFVHVLAYGTAGAGQIIASLAVIFGLSLVLGGIYERTDNLFVPALVHGIYNAVLFANLYLTYV
ncbi:CPBP family intramembrane glutamic endopeptidase [Halopiger djelfimassiliensis]|uniref:CPBP family intramembrane glutamic endopeptidase n=1 Tax=Halopiger djelfimassiliensis TaxID=1293047 RepID=UPI000677D241|nr:type II CAAX endopeptidase family protein [Halopiger djelfimassiliensis]